MIAIHGRNFRAVYDEVVSCFRWNSQVVDPSTWQGRDVSAKPEMATHELEDVVIEFPIGTEDLDHHRLQVGPNLPWADEHFEKDRACGFPRNPGLTWQDWPYSLKADGFRDKAGQFNHTYAERYWPKHAGTTKENDGVPTPDRLTPPLWGIRYEYGDLNDVVGLLVRNPLTRGAYLPVTFPEDTGIVHGGRTPCTIGYLFRMRHGELNVFYDIRSCDLKRHFRDDVYLTVRLLLWVLAECRKGSPAWSDVRPGRFVMHVGSFHLFRNDFRVVLGG